MTEDEAKTKWCPFVRYTVEQEEGVTPARNAWIEYSKKQRIPEMARCIASQCMAWRTRERVLEGVKISDKPATVLDGHCGLAGTP